MFDHAGFDKRFELTRKMAIGWAVINGVVGLGGLLFVGWVIVKLMQHFGIV